MPHLFQNVVFFDGHYSHAKNNKFLRIIEECEKDILPVKLPSGMTDAWQPLDVAVFGQFKKCWKDYLRDNRLSIDDEVGRLMFEFSSQPHCYSLL